MSVKKISYSHTLILSYILTLSSCSFGPVTSNTARMVEPSAYQPSPPASTNEGLYFKVISNSPYGESLGQTADNIYQDILSDTKLTESLRPYSLYPLYIYGSRQEYLSRTGMPEWSGGMFDRGRIFTYGHNQTLRVLAHEITHLIFWEFFASPRSDLLWLNEGLAMHEEYRLDSQEANIVLQHGYPVLRIAYIPLAQLFQTRTALDHKDKEAQAFYLQSWLLTKFLLVKGGNVGFYSFMQSLKAEEPIERALANAYPGRWPNIQLLEQAFKIEYGL